MASTSTYPQNTPSSPPSFTRKLLLTALVVVVLYILYTVLSIAFKVFLVFFAALLFGVFLYSVSKFLHRHTKIPYKFCLTLTVLLFFAVVAGGLYALGPSLSSQTEQLQKDIPRVISELRTKIASMPYGEKLLQRIPSPQEWVKNQDSLMNSAFSFFSSTLGALANIIIIIVLGIYLAATPSSTANGLVRLVPFPRRPRAREVLHVLRYTIWGWLKGTLLAMVLIGTIVGIGLWIIGVPLPLLFGVFSGIMEFIPNIGPFIASAPAILLAFVQDPTMALYTIILFVVVQSMEGYIITPLVQKRIIDLPPILTIMAQLVLGLMAGFWGLLLAVPIIAVIMVLVKMLYIEDTLGDYGIEVKGEEDAIAKEEKHQRQSPSSKETEG